MQNFKVLRILLATIATVIGLIMVIGGIFGIITVFSGGTVYVPVPNGSNSKTISADGLIGLENALFCLVLGCCMLRAVFKSRLGTKVVKVEEEIKVVTTETPKCCWWQDENDDWHREENPLFIDKYPEDGICPQCGKPIEIITNQIYANKE